MRLLRGLLLRSLLVALACWAPLAFWSHSRLRTQTEVSALARLRGSLARERRTCDADPAAWVERNRRLRWMVYGADLQPLAPDVPALDREIFAVLKAGQPGKSVWRQDAEGPFLLTAAKWSNGTCAFVSARQKAPDLSPQLQQAALWAAPRSLAFALLAALVLAGPLLLRLRRLGRQHGLMSKQGSLDEIEALAGALEARQEAISERSAELEATEDSLKHLASELAEELWLPLTALQARVAGLEAERPKDWSESVQLCHQLSRRVSLRVVSSSLAGPHGVFVPFDLGRAVDRVVLHLRALSRARGLSFEWAAPEPAVQVKGAPPLVEGALSELLQSLLESASGTVSLTLDGGSGRFLLRAFAPLQAPLALPEICFAVAERQGFRLSLAQDESDRDEIRLEGPLLDPAAPSAPVLTA